MKRYALTFSLLAMPLSSLAFDDVSIEPSINSTFSQYDQSNAFESSKQFLDVEFMFDINLNLSETVHLQMTPRFRADNRDRVDSNLYFSETHEQRDAVGFNELILNYYGEKFEINLGKQLISWGSSDIYNPSDDINPIDSLDPLNSAKIGQNALSIRYLGELLNFHTVAIYEGFPGRLPNEQNRWFISTQALQDAAQLLLGFAPAIVLGETIPNDDLLYGLQIESSQLIAGWDLEFSYFHGADPIGVYLSELTGTDLNLIRIYPAFDEYALGFSTTVGEYEIHGALSHHNTRNDLQDDDYTTTVIGGRRTFYELPLLSMVEELTVGMEYANESLSNQRSDASSYVDSGFGRSLTDSILVNIDFKFSEDSSLYVNYVENFEKNDNYRSIGFRHKINDDFEIEVRFDGLAGETNSFFGGWSNNDRLIAQSSYRF
jgi:hypothetical protein